MNYTALRYDTGEPVRVTLDHDRISRVEPAWPRGPVDDWPWVAPGLFDPQINGHSGVWYCDPDLTAERVRESLPLLLSRGITRFFPTLITQSFAALAAGFSAIRAACEQDPLAARMIAGCHLEGPYISPEDGPRGAHPREHVRPANEAEFEELQRISGGRIRLITVAPEVPGVLELIPRAVAGNVTVAIGHTAATGEEIRAAVAAGATLSTHLGNGISTQLHRHRNPILEQLDHPELWASLIADGHHLPPSVLRTLLRARTPRRTILTCDAAGWAGCPPGIYHGPLGSTELLPNGKLVVAGQTELLAGSAVFTDECVCQVMTTAGLSLGVACDLAGKNPAKLFGAEVVRLKPGSRADLVLFNWKPTATRFDIRCTISGGELCYGSIPAILD